MVSCPSDARSVAQRHAQWCVVGTPMTFSLRKGAGHGSNRLAIFEDRGSHIGRSEKDQGSSGAFFAMAFEFGGSRDRDLSTLTETIPSRSITMLARQFGESPHASPRAHDRSCAPCLSPACRSAYHLSRLGSLVDGNSSKSYFGADARKLCTNAHGCVAWAMSSPAHPIALC